MPMPTQHSLSTSLRPTGTLRTQVAIHDLSLRSLAATERQQLYFLRRVEQLLPNPAPSSI